MKIDEIKELDKQLEKMCEYMSDEEFNDSKDVEAMYSQLKELIQE
jgi:cell division FtsZ-interacting protein ZapD